MANKLLKTLNFGNEDTYDLAPSWDNVQNKPFKTVGGDTLTWDGNTEGLDFIVGVDANIYKISDNVPTVSEITEYTLLGFEEFMGVLTQENAPVITLGDIIVLGNGMCMIAPFDGAILEDGESTMTFDKKGVYSPLYVMDDKSYFISSLTINGYTGFTTTTINEDCIPHEKLKPVWANIQDKPLDIFVVNMSSTDGTTYTANKTFDEITEAVNNGKMVMINGGASVLTFSSSNYDENETLTNHVFSTIMYMGGILVGMEVTITNDETVTVSQGMYSLTPFG